MSHPIYTVGDSSPDLTGTVYATAEDGTATYANLTGATIVLHVRKPSGVVVTAPAAISGDPLNGSWLYGWNDPALNSIDETGLWLIEGQVTYANGKVQTFGPNAIRVLPQLA